MSCMIQRYSFDEALDRLEQYEYALLYMISELRLCRTEDIGSVDWSQCIEARFFSKEAELHVFERNGEMTAVELSDNDGKDQNERRYELKSYVYSEFGKIVVKEYFTYDEDGQLIIEAARLAALA